MADARLEDQDWRMRVGFDNIDPNPWRPLQSKRVEREFANPISARIDAELFGRKR